MKLKSKYSPASELLEGDLVIMNCDPGKGFCVVVEGLKTADEVAVRFLDSQLPAFFLPANCLIPSGKQSSLLLKHLESRGLDFNKALDEERRMPDFAPRKAKKSASPKEKKPLTEIQKNYLGELIKARLKELGAKEKGD